MYWYFEQYSIPIKYQHSPSLSVWYHIKYCIIHDTLSVLERNCIPQTRVIIMDVLTHRGLSLFLKTVPISNIAYILATVHFLYPKLGTFFDMEYYICQFANRDSKVPTRFVKLNKMQCFPYSDWNWGKQNDPTACWHQLHRRFQVLQQGKCLSYALDHMGRVNEPPIALAARGLCPLRTPINRGTTPFKIPHPPYLLFRQNGSRIPSKFLAFFHEFIHAPSISSASNTIWTTSGRGQMSHICNISALRVN